MYIIKYVSTKLALKNKNIHLSLQMKYKSGKKRDLEVGGHFPPV